MLFRRRSFSLNKLDALDMVFQMIRLQLRDIDGSTLQHSDLDNPSNRWLEVI